MEDGVKFIFRTLIKIPCFVIIAYIIFNLFCFSITYFKMMGASYAIMQVSMENNYIPKTELDSLNSYVQQFNSASNNGNITEANGTNMISDIKIVKGTNEYIFNDSTSTYERKFENVAWMDGDTKVSSVDAKKDRKQYGETITYGLTYKYNWIWPLNTNQLAKTVGGSENKDGSEDGVAGLGGGQTTLRSRADYIRNGKNTLDSEGTIEFIHTVPGLQYYSDLD